MKLNISSPASGCQKSIAIDDDKKLSIFYGRRMGQEIEGDNLGDEFKGYIFKITGGNDKDGFSMKQGILVNGRVRILMSKGHKCYRPRRNGERKRKSVRGCIVGPDLSVIALSIVKAGESNIAGLTDNKLPKRLGPKRATRIRKLFALKKEDDVRRFVIRRKIEKEGKPVRFKAPRIQRLVTDARLRRKRLYKASKKLRWETTKKAVADYHKKLDDFKKKKALAHKQEVTHLKELAHIRKASKESGTPKSGTAGASTFPAAGAKKGAATTTAQPKGGQTHAPKGGQSQPKTGQPTTGGKGTQKPQGGQTEQKTGQPTTGGKGTQKPQGGQTEQKTGPPAGGKGKETGQETKAQTGKGTKK